MIWHYPNSVVPLSAAPEMVQIDYLYCFRWEDFTREQWRLLEDIFGQLPGARNAQAGWFGEEQAPHLESSVEPPGLQVSGTLRLVDWLRWNASFRERVEAASLPLYEP